MEKNLMAIVDLKLKSKKFDTYQNIKYRRIKYWFNLNEFISKRIEKNLNNLSAIIHKNSGKDMIIVIFNCK